jgi:Domain of unknown function (DUF929)
VVVLVIAIALVATLASGSKPSKPAQPATGSLLGRVTSIPTDVFAKVGMGTSTMLPEPLSAPALTADGKPQILYIGAEYCPFCATERWPMVIALSRFGTFTGLKTTHSSSTDVFPDTATFSFHGATFTSKWIAFTGVETATNERQGNGYAPLDQPTPAQQQLFATYDMPPYTTSAGGIPFIDFGGRFVLSGAGYDASVLGGKSTEQIADALSDPGTAISKGAVGTANTLTAAICSLTNDEPANVCDNATIRQIEASLR